MGRQELQRPYSRPRSGGEGPNRAAQGKRGPMVRDYAEGRAGMPGACPEGSGLENFPPTRSRSPPNSERREGPGVKEGLHRRLAEAPAPLMLALFVVVRIQASRSACSSAMSR